MKTVGVNISHDSSFCRCINGEVSVFLEEERLSRRKHDEIPTQILLELLEEGDELNFTGLEYEGMSLRDAIDNICRYVLKSEAKFLGHREHHVFHTACGFYNSGFEEADVVVVDGMGNCYDDEYHECASRWHCKKPHDIQLIEHQVTMKYGGEEHLGMEQHQHWPMGIGMVYAGISAFLGFGELGSGKTMGLAAYGKEDKNIKSFLLDDGRIDSTLFYRTKGGAHFIPYDYLPKHWDYRNWNEDVQRVANLAYRLQKDFEEWMTSFILKCDHENIVLSGGCALNCVANYEYLKHLPKDVNLYIEPVSNDAGTAIGLAKYLYYENS